MPLSRQEKKTTAQQIAVDLKKYPVIGIASLQNLPSRQLNTIRNKLRGKAVFEITRSSLLKRAIAQARPDLVAISDKFEGSTALICTDMDPFKLYKLIKSAKSKAFAKPGAITPVDILVQAGETTLPPGPVLSELKAVKLDARIQGPKIVIGKDAMVAKKGDVISPQLAAVLTKLDIQPMEIALNVICVNSQGTTYLAEVLNIDEEQFMQKLHTAAASATNLGVFAGIYNASTITPILAKAVRAATAVHGVVASKMNAGTTPAAPAEHEKPVEVAAAA